MLERDGPLTEHDYLFLLGDVTYWTGWGAAYAVTMEWCKNHGYGDFGKPTEKGQRAIEAYARVHANS